MNICPKCKKKVKSLKGDLFGFNKPFVCEDCFPKVYEVEE